MEYINPRADDVMFSSMARMRIAGRFLLGIQRDSATAFLMEVEPTMEILLKRAYEAADRADGFRVLVDRLWPRGKKKVDLRLDAWAKDISPSTELRQWFNHDPQRWVEFCKRYKAELRAPEIKHAIAEIVHAAAKHASMTLIYGAKDTLHNDAVVLLPIFKRAATKAAKA